MAVVSIKNKLRRGNLLVGNDAFIPSSFESIATATGTGSSGTITFSSIPGTYQHLQIRVMCKYVDPYSPDNLRMQFNSDTGSNYAYHRLQGNGSAASASGSASASDIFMENLIPGSGLTNTMGVAIIDIHDYANTSKNKTTRSFFGLDANTASTDYRVQLHSGLWMSTSAISTITLSVSGTSFSTSSTFALYGIKGA